MSFPIGGRQSLAAREQSRRRALLLGVAALLVLGTSPVFGHHLATRLGESLAGRDHFLNVCLVALHELLAPVHSAFHVLLLTGIAYAIADRVRAGLRARGTLGLLAGRLPSDGDPFAVAARMAGVPRKNVRIVHDLPVPAFTAGWLRPRIYVADSLRRALTPAELAAVLAHEQSHVARRDPLRLFALRFLACLLFYIPALRRLADDLADEAEIIADDAAVARPGIDPLGLASAILVLSRFRGIDRSAAVVVGFHRDDLMDRRVRRLAGEEPVIATHVTRRSLVGAGSLLAAVWVSGLVMAHPLPAEPVIAPGPDHQGHGTHCEHHGSWPLAHLFCRGLDGFSAPRAGAPPAAGPHCPHAGL